MACASAELAVTSASVSACVAVCDCLLIGWCQTERPRLPCSKGVMTLGDPGGQDWGAGGPEGRSQGSREDDQPGGRAAWKLGGPYSPGALLRLPPSVLQSAHPPSVNSEPGCARRRAEKSGTSRALRPRPTGPASGRSLGLCQDIFAQPKTQPARLGTRALLPQPLSPLFRAPSPRSGYALSLR